MVMKKEMPVSTKKQTAIQKFPECKSKKPANIPKGSIEVPSAVVPLNIALLCAGAPTLGIATGAKR